MYPLTRLHRSNGQLPSRQKYQQMPRSFSNGQGFSNTKMPLVRSSSVSQYCDLIQQKAEVISSVDLANILNELYNYLENVGDQGQLFVNLRDIVGALTNVRKVVLATLIEHKFFNLLHEPFLNILRQWNNSSGLNADQGLMFHYFMKLSKKLFSEVTNPDHYPSWLTDQLSLDTVASSFMDISKSRKFFEERNNNETRSFLLLLDIYVEFQKDIYDSAEFNQDKLVQLLDPVAHCLTSPFYVETFRDIQRGTSMPKKDKFFLVKCPTFLTNYAGTRLQPTMTYILTTMSSKYITILDELIPIIKQWNPQTMRAVTQMLKIINHAPIYPKITSSYLPFIDHVLKIVDEPKFYTKLQNDLSSRETNLIHVAVSLLANMISDPTILTHIKQKRFTPAFLRLASAPYEPIVYDIYNILAYTITEEDIKSMHNPGILLSTVIKALKKTVSKKSDNEDEVIQLFETLKGLVQHDQIKEEILKQNALPFMFECTNKVTPAALPLLFETLWSSSFSQAIARILRANTQLLEQIRTISKTTQNEPLKKAVDGLAWKLVKEPEFLDRAAKRADEDGLPTTKTIIGPDGKEQLITTTKQSSIAEGERTFQYDIMISYCHAEKDLIVKIHKFLLDQGFKIWIDLNNMFGPAMSAMAEAVENSEFVLLCMSDSYKRSTYCQAEAEYAFNCKRRLVPLIVRPGYKADGWLGFMIGTRIYVDFGFFDFDTACGKLMDEISRQRKRPFASNITHVTQQPEKSATKASDSTEKSAIKASDSTEKSATKTSDSTAKSVADGLPDIYTKRKVGRHFNNIYIDRWMESDVLDFLFTHKLFELMPICDKMDGPALIQLYKMCLPRHNRTYSLLNDQFKETFKMILPFGTYARFLSIMERVTRPPTQVQMMLPPPQPPKMLMPPVPSPALTEVSNSDYDLLVTSNANPMQILKMVEHVGSQWRIKTPANY